MAFKIQKFPQLIGLVMPTQKLWLTADRSRLVPDGHKDAAFLFCIPGRPIEKAEAARYGLLEADKPEKPKTPAPVRPNAQTKVILPNEE